MTVEIDFNNIGERERVDYLTLSNGKDAVTLDWDESEIASGNHIGRGVYIFPENKDDSLPDEYYHGNGRIKELDGYFFESAQLYDPDTDEEREVFSDSYVIKSITVEDGDTVYEVPILPACQGVMRKR